MSELFKTLNSIRGLRNIARELTLEQLESIQGKLQVIVDEKRAELENIQRQQAERQERIAKYKELLKQDGITVEELSEILSNSPVQARKKREPRPAKYQYTDENGVVKSWTGQGRTPRAIQAALNAGKSLSDFAI